MPARRWCDNLTIGSLLSEIMFSILFEAALAIAILMAAPSALLLLCLAITAGIAVFWLLGRLADKIWQLLLPAAVLIGGPLFLQSLPVWPRVIFCAAMLVLAIRTLANRVRSETTDGEAPPFTGVVAGLGWLLLVNLAAAWQNLTGLVSACFYLGIAYLLLSVIRRHHLALNNRLARFMPVATQPTGRIKLISRLLLIGFVGILLLILLISPVLHLEEAIPWLAALLLAALKKFVQLLLSIFNNPGGSQTNPSETSPPSEPGGLPGESSEIPQWLEVLQQIFYYVLLAGAIMLILALIVYVIYSIYRRFYENRSTGTDVFEMLRPKLANEIKSNIQRGKARWARQFGRNPEQKIRRYYSRTVDDLIKKGLQIASGTTPRDIVGLSESPSRIILGEITDLYEIARYSREPCTNSDVRRMLELCRQLRLKQENDKNG